MPVAEDRLVALDAGKAVAETVRVDRRAAAAAVAEASTHLTILGEQKSQQGAAHTGYRNACRAH
ncbi:MAG TPA: hypothetical protein VF826_19760 [Chloroflexia bacterium]